MNLKDQIADCFGAQLSNKDGDKLQSRTCLLSFTGSAGMICSERS